MVITGLALEPNCKMKVTGITKRIFKLLTILQNIINCKSTSRIFPWILISINELLFKLLLMFYLLQSTSILQVMDIKPILFLIKCLKMTSRLLIQIRLRHLEILENVNRVIYPPIYKYVCKTVNKWLVKKI